MKEIDGEEVYSVALVTDSDCITLFMALNTYEFLETADEEYLEMVKDDLSEEDMRQVEEGEVCLTKWLPDEWGYSDDESSELSKISQVLYKKEASNPEEYAKYKALFFDTVTSAFKKVIEEKTFGENSEEVTYFISTSDGDEIYEIENHSAKKLNSEKVYEQFLSRKELEEDSEISYGGTYTGKKDEKIEIIFKTGSVSEEQYIDLIEKNPNFFDFLRLFG